MTVYGVDFKKNILKCQSDMFYMWLSSWGPFVCWKNTIVEEKATCLCMVCVVMMDNYLKDGQRIHDLIT